MTAYRADDDHVHPHEAIAGNRSAGRCSIASPQARTSEASQPSAELLRLWRRDRPYEAEGALE